MKVIKTDDGCLSILMGKTGMGKSTIAVYDSVDYLREGKDVIYFSYEYCQSIVYNKLITHFGLKWQDLFRLNVVDSTGLSLDHVVDIIKNSNANIVYVDYLSLLRTATFVSEKDNLDIKKMPNSQIIVQKLAEIANDMNISIVLLSREVEDAKFEDTVNHLNEMSSTVKNQSKIIKMFIGRDEIFSSMINCNDISHVVLVDGYNLKHFSSINVKEVYKD